MLEHPSAGVWAIADGMGGHKGGDVAAEILIQRLADIAAPSCASSITNALAQANSAILATGHGQSGTTVVLVHIDADRANFFWAGDSRAYLIRGGNCQLLTHDHSVVQELVDAGALTPLQALGHPHANLITRALGIAEAVVIDHACEPLFAGDRLLLCSDGLSRSLSERDKVDLGNLEDQCDKLLMNALQRDGSDNISFILIDVADWQDDQRQSSISH